MKHLLRNICVIAFVLLLSIFQKYLNISVILCLVFSILLTGLMFLKSALIHKKANSNHHPHKERDRQ